ncbi:hypothetical protein [uncultured Psychroserpens sp.]|uniref:hypothetical protein n=1 Tax=uncultured Psychroserpens sp. TaxID=255436 RepID=UPI00262C9B7D|nr:hypothetical protein [uncultured Psychroserpens sp.]
MKNDFKKIAFVLAFFLMLSCSENTQESPSNDNQNQRIGAIYISCESPSWIFNFDDLFSCEQTEPAQEQLNPDNACPMSDIETQDGEIEILFSDNLDLGRLLIRVSDDAFMEDENGNQVSELYVNDHDEWFLSKYDIRLKLTIINVYVGNCYHELIKWEESPIIN